MTREELRKRCEALAGVGDAAAAATLEALNELRGGPAGELRQRDQMELERFRCRVMDMLQSLSECIAYWPSTPAVPPGAGKSPVAELVELHEANQKLQKLHAVTGWAVPQMPPGYGFDIGQTPGGKASEYVSESPRPQSFATRPEDVSGPESYGQHAIPATRRFTDEELKTLAKEMGTLLPILERDGLPIADSVSLPPRNYNAQYKPPEKRSEEEREEMVKFANDHLTNDTQAPSPEEVAAAATRAAQGLPAVQDPGAYQANTDKPVSTRERGTGV